ncbi:GNAT family N-acetyltransferase [filamentous cyanobacterium LEGE 11480]|uniref:GNAT family N-acetyltransferase n=1 Tax=Romeriopsis navalis LEGE 11480 TaxID=2777977 RepID=A0A928VMS1_9CYAN|nr:MSMEG_0567/Sll0786 family nitrogen starvation N-acetyltransferase [Romeriopsis navalis]MBE9028829.1 GNAT family N-acetyltransferase [Romeriopsis navalis LEGE 11480]
MQSNRYSFKLALSAAEIQGYFALRQAIFCEEQGVFHGSDVDEIDATAYPIVAIDHEAAPDQQVVGVVRIYEETSRHWYGGRLGVHPDYRRVGRIGKGLIDKAVTTANTWGCEQFLATVQLQNVRFFQRLHWDSLQELDLHGLPHHLMQADLAYYPPGNEVRPIITWVERQVS